MRKDQETKMKKEKERLEIVEELGRHLKKKDKERLESVEKLGRHLEQTLGEMRVKYKQILSLDATGQYIAQYCLPIINCRLVIASVDTGGVRSFFGQTLLPKKPVLVIRLESNEEPAQIREWTKKEFPGIRIAAVICGDGKGGFQIVDGK